MTTVDDSSSTAGAAGYPRTVSLGFLAPSKRIELGVSIVIPCFNEERSVRRTIEQIGNAMAGVPDDWEIVLVNDGSRDGTGAILDEMAATDPRLRVVHHARNCGYGASLKDGILKADYNRIVITDADGTYPNEVIPSLLKELEECDMAVGARIGAKVAIPLLRRPAKWLLLQIARWAANADIKDLNSGLRAMRVERIYPFWNMFPRGFSFTTTITLAMHASGLSVRYIPINYHKRVGSSTIRPLRDTFNFFMLIFRTLMYHKPLPFFGATAILLMLASMVVAVGSKLLTGMVADVSSVILFATGVIFLGMGLLGDLINARRPM